MRVGQDMYVILWMENYMETPVGYRELVGKTQGSQTNGSGVYVLSHMVQTGFSSELVSCYLTTVLCANHRFTVAPANLMKGPNRIGVSLPSTEN
jgi:hypothetical protein